MTTSARKKSFVRLPSGSLTVVLLSAFLGGIIIVFLPVWKGLVHTWWSSDEYSHGFLIIPLSLYIVWRKRAALGKLRMEPSAWGLAVGIGSLLLYLLGQAGEIATLSSLSVILFLSGVIIYLFGFPTLKAVSFSLFLLVFMIPVPGQLYSELTVPLQLMVSRVSAWIASHLGVALYQEGNLLHLADRTFEVLYACSGLRSLISLLALSAVFGYFTLQRKALRAVLFLSAVPAAILVNMVRVLLMILVFYYFGYDLTAHKIHSIFGIFIFFLAVLLIMATRWLLGRWDVSPAKD
jgi:exosortase A